MRLVLVPITILCLNLGWASGNECPEESFLILANTKRIYQARDSRYPLETYAAQGELAPDGTLKLVFRTRDMNGNRSSVLSGREQFDSVMKYFGKKVNAIEGNWKLTANSYTDNLDLFNAYLIAHPDATAEEAAKNTWTAKQANRHGFSEVEIVKLKGPRGDYGEVVVRFLKPNKIRQSK